LALRDWLEAHAVTHIAMESTGVYWKPVFSVLEEAFACLLVNAAHIKQVPGRKADVKDCMWIAQCLEHGLLRGSFVPPAAIREIRDLTRHRKVLIQERTQAANRVHKLLEDAGAKLASVATNILGVSGRARRAMRSQGREVGSHRRILSWTALDSGAHVAVHGCSRVFGHYATSKEASP
jgi:transposase